MCVDGVARDPALAGSFADVLEFLGERYDIEFFLDLQIEHGRFGWFNDLGDDKALASEIGTKSIVVACANLNVLLCDGMPQWRVDEVEPVALTKRMINTRHIRAANH